MGSGDRSVGAVVAVGVASQGDPGYGDPLDALPMDVLSDVEEGEAQGIGIPHGADLVSRIWINGIAGAGRRRSDFSSSLSPLTLGAHAQRELRYLLRVCVCVCPLHFGHYEYPENDTNASSRQGKENKTGDFL